MDFSEIFSYSEGKLYWKIDRHKKPAGDEAGWFDKDGYLLITLPRKLKPIGGRVFKAHRIVWELHNGPVPEGHIVEHKDGKPSNNCIGNLRLATTQQNMWNRKAVKSKVDSKGVQLTKHGTFRARIRTPEGARLDLGIWKTESEAAAAYLTAAKILFGPFARKE